jgi:hypothetical protein
MLEFDWTAALDAMGRGHSMVGIDAVRKMMGALGIEGLPLHPLERAEVLRLREAAQRNSAAATAIEQRATVDE